MNSKYVDQLLKRAAQFEKLAQDQGNEFWNVPLTPKYKWSFVDVAQALFETLTQSHVYAEDLDAGTNKAGPAYKLNEMMKANKLPDPTEFMSLVQGMRDRVAQVPDSDPNAAADKNVANYLVVYANDLIAKFFNKTEEQKPQDQKQQQPKQDDDATKYATETLPMFLSRLYRKLRAGQPLSDFDNSKLPIAKPPLQRRLNGLNGLATRTPAQEQERQLIQFVLSKV